MPRYAYELEIADPRSLWFKRYSYLVFYVEHIDVWRVFARRLMYVVLVAGILLGATQIVALFGSTGASIGDVTMLVSGAGDEAHGRAWLELGALANPSSAIAA